MDFFPHTVFINEVSVFSVMVHSSASAATQINAVATLIGCIWVLLGYPLHLTDHSSIFSLLFAILVPNSSPQLQKEETNSVTK